MAKTFFLFWLYKPITIFYETAEVYTFLIDFKKNHKKAFQVMKNYKSKKENIEKLDSKDSYLWIKDEIIKFIFLDFSTLYNVPSFYNWNIY